MLAALGGLSELTERWLSEESYNHGFVMLAVALYFAYRATPNAMAEPRYVSWIGVIASFAAVLILTLSEVAQIRTLSQYSVLALLFAVPLAAFGWKFSRHYLPATTMLLFVIPLPFYLQVAVTAKLQLWSSALGVAGIKLLDIPVYLEGNLIDLGVYQLQVVEACSGLNYLYPIVGIAFIFAYINKGTWWQRAIVLLSAIPIAILMNGFRIVVVGVLVSNFGPEAAEGFLHEFQGFAVFALCMVLLALVAWLAARLKPIPKDRPTGAGKTDRFQDQKLSAGSPGPYYVLVLTLALLLASHLTTSYVSAQPAAFPTRTTFALFPTTVGKWVGARKRMNIQSLSLLNPTDYTAIDYIPESSSLPIEFYTAYYENQKEGASIHSPKVCLPGGGWEILKIEPIEGLLGETSKVNRAVLQSGSEKMLSYYWFEQRGRALASEFWLKWYLLIDGLLSKRSDGALVRFTTKIDRNQGDSLELADARVLRLIGDLKPLLPDYIPGR